MPGKKRGPEHKNVVGWGGSRQSPGKKQGRPKKPNKRVTASYSLTPAVKEVVAEIALTLGCSSNSRAVEIAIKKLAEDIGAKP